MYLLGRNVTSVLQALLTKWMGSSEAVTDTFPSPSIASLDSRVTVVSFVALVLFLFMFGTVATLC